MKKDTQTSQTEQTENCLSILDLIRSAGFEHLSKECIK